MTTISTEVRIPRFRIAACNMLCIYTIQLEPGTFVVMAGKREAYLITPPPLLSCTIYHYLL